MEPQEIIEKLNTLADWRAQRDLFAMQRAEQIDQIEAERQAKITALMPPELVEALLAIDAEAEQKKIDLNQEYNGRNEAVIENITNLEEEIKEAVKSHGASVKGDFLHAVFAKGRESVDINAFAGYVVAHPEAKTLIKTGEPTVSIRATK